MEYVGYMRYKEALEEASGQMMEREDGRHSIGNEQVTVYSITTENMLDAMLDEVGSMNSGEKHAPDLRLMTEHMNMLRNEYVPGEDMGVLYRDGESYAVSIDIKAPDGFDAEDFDQMVDTVWDDSKGYSWRETRDKFTEWEDVPGDIADYGGTIRQFADAAGSAADELLEEHTLQELGSMPVDRLVTQMDETIDAETEAEVRDSYSQLKQHTAEIGRATAGLGVTMVGLAEMKAYSRIFMPEMTRSYALERNTKGVRFMETADENYINISAGMTDEEIVFDTAEDVAQYLDEKDI